LTGLLGPETTLLTTATICRQPALRHLQTARPLFPTTWTFMMLGMYANRQLGPAAENARASRSGKALTDKQISMLDERSDEFRAADY